MRRRFVRWFVAAFLVILGAACPAVGFAVVSQAQPQVSQQSAQALSTLDREFLTVINFANLWEVPMGDLAAKNGTTQRVRDVGATIASDHRKLTTAVTDLATKFGVTLTEQPSSSTAKWMSEIRAASGEQFDKLFADRLRAAHGTVFGLIAEVRAGTRNSAIRDFATQANNIVMKHMSLLESTGDVDSEHGMFSEAAARSITTPENSLSGGDLMLAAVVAGLMMVATIGVVRTYSAHGSAE
jgi:predicted outer membrane protein